MTDAQQYIDTMTELLAAPRSLSPQDLTPPGRRVGPNAIEQLYKASAQANAALRLLNQPNQSTVSLLRVRSVDGDTDLDIGTDTVIGVDSTAGPVVVTLPLASTAPADGFLREFYVWHAAGTNLVTIQLSGADTFPPGNTKILLPFAGNVAHLGVVPNQWGSITAQSIYTQIGRTNTWAAVNFGGGGAAVPFDAEYFEVNDEIIEWDPAQPTRLVVKTPGVYEFGYWYSIDSTGGATWNCISFLRKNGVDQLNESRIVTGNFGGEDDGSSVGPVNLQLAANDYIELFLSQTNLTGNLLQATLTAKILL